MCQLILQQYNEHSSQLFLNKFICIWHSWQVNRIPQTVQLLDRIQIYSWFLYFQAGHLHKSERWILWDAILVHQNKSVLKLLHFLNKPAFVTWIHWAKHCQGSLEIIHSQHYLVNTKVKLQKFQSHNYQSTSCNLAMFPLIPSVSGLAVNSSGQLQVFWTQSIVTFLIGFFRCIWMIFKVDAFHIHAFIKMCTFKFEKLC